MLNVFLAVGLGLLVIFVILFICWTVGTVIYWLSNDPEELWDNITRFAIGLVALFVSFGGVLLAYAFGVGIMEAVFGVKV